MSTWKGVLLKYIDGYDSLGSTQQSVTCKKTQNIFVCRNELYEDILQVLIGHFCWLGPTCKFAGFFWVNSVLLELELFQTSQQELL